jgi:hypothetical protein
MTICNVTMRGWGTPGDGDQSAPIFMVEAMPSVVDDDLVWIHNRP